MKYIDMNAIHSRSSYVSPEIIIEEIECTNSICGSVYLDGERQSDLFIYDAPDDPRLADSELELGWDDEWVIY